MMKRIILIVSCMLLIVAFVGCSKKANEDNTKATEDVSTEETADVDTEVTPEAVAEATPEAVAEVIMAAVIGDTVGIYKDGTYTVETEKPDAESYITKATVTIKDGKITAVDWTIYDVPRDNKPFDADYKEVFNNDSDPNNKKYYQQSIDDWNGSRGYAPQLIETQDVSKVDAVSGATWPYKKFVNIINMALEQASMYKDGTYEVETAQKDYEGYITKGILTIQNGKISGMDWTIFDVNNNVPFDEAYKELLADSKLYYQQSIDDWNGSRGYEPQLIETQDVKEVDAVSGATWTYKKFVEITNIAIEQAIKR